jgi:2-polyprenyl-3-methyl-5-hydroxy-6-metoxy-1,4-benzoquinol methylase
MIQEPEPRRFAALAAPRLEELSRLPQPLHLLEFVDGTQHYHFGCFESPDEPVRRAQDRMSLLAARRFAPGSAVLDIGCGLGGTSQLLASRGLSVTAIDPCGERLAYARERAAGLLGAPRFLARTLEEHANAGEAALDGALALEVLQHFRDLSQFFGACRRLLRPGGTLVVHDLSTRVEVDWERVSFHFRGRARAAAEAAGFRVLEHVDRTAEVLPTLPSLARALRERRAELVRAFGLPGPAARPVEDELAELLAHVGALQHALEIGDLAYETTVFQSGSPRSASPCA